jgi:hypothetical protein
VQRLYVSSRLDHAGAEPALRVLNGLWGRGRLQASSEAAVTTQRCGGSEEPCLEFTIGDYYRERNVSALNSGPLQ